MESVEFGSYLKKLRKDKNMTIRQLELYSQVSNAYISQLERGERGIPSPEILQKLAKPLGVDYEVLMKKAGYIKEDTNATGGKALDIILEKISDHIKLDSTKLASHGIKVKEGEQIKINELVPHLTIEEKTDMLMAFLGNPIEVDLSKDEDGKPYFTIRKNKLYIDISDETLADNIVLYYDGMELTKDEKIEFLAIARAIFSARRGLKRNQ